MTGVAPLPPGPAAPVRRRYAALTPEQVALADDLAARAGRLRANADGELSVAEAVALAAVQLGFYDVSVGP